MNTLGIRAKPAVLPKSCLTVFLMVLVLASMVLGGCNAVLVEEPMGDVVVTLDPATWQGTWVTDEVVILTTMLDSEKGVLQAAWVERGAEGEGARFESVTGTVRQTGDMLFLNIEQEPSEEQGTTAATVADAPATDAPPAAAAVAQAPVTGAPVHSRSTVGAESIIMASASSCGCRTSSSSSRRCRTVACPELSRMSDDVVLGPLDPAQLELINSPAGNLLNWSEPLVFVRIGD